MTNATRKWDDLTPRIATGLSLALAGGLGIWLGGAVFLILIAISAALMVWELVGMIAPDKSMLSLVCAALVGFALCLVQFVPGIAGYLLFLVSLSIGVLFLTRYRLIFGFYTAAIIVSSLGLLSLRQDQGLDWVAWLVLVVAASDIAGYLAGRLLGGPKFWPRISPKKTWSGTVGGWVASALVGVFFMKILDTGAALITISVLVAFAAQMGDIAESAIKRLCGVKDSSNLLPGHGGLLDRFDGVIGATLIVYVMLLMGVLGSVTG